MQSGEIAPVPVHAEGKRELSAHSHNSQLTHPQTTMTVTPTNLSPDPKSSHGNADRSTCTGTSTAAAALNLNSTDEESAMSSSDEPCTSNNTCAANGDGGGEGSNGNGSGDLSVHLPLHVKNIRDLPPKIPPPSPVTEISTSSGNVTSVTCTSSVMSVHQVHHQQQHQENPHHRSRSSTLSSPPNGGENDSSTIPDLQQKMRPLHEQNFQNKALTMDTASICARANTMVVTNMNGNGNPPPHRQRDKNHPSTDVTPSSHVIPTAIIPPTGENSTEQNEIKKMSVNITVNLDNPKESTARLVSDITTGSNDGENLARSKILGEIEKNQAHARKKPASGTNIEGNQDENDVGDDELLPKVPLSFDLDVSSALDLVLNEDKQLSTQPSLSIVASSITESGKDNTGERPCILQQSKIGDSSSIPPSGASSICGDESSIEGMTMNNTNSTVSMSGTDEKSSVSVKSSMLVPEESLNLIAQMTVDPPLSQVSTSNASSPATLVAAAVDGSEKGLDTTKIKNTICTNDNLGKCSAIKEKKILKAPLISGTAAAQFEALSRKNNCGKNSSLSSSQPLAPPPQLRNCVSAQNAHISSNCMSNSNSELKESAANHASGDQVKRHVNGMDMLAKITSHAVPIVAPHQTSEQPCATNGNIVTSNSQVPASQRILESARGGATERADLDHSIVPVGQSLSVYSAIAAQAGVTTHKPAPLPVSAPQSDSQVQRLQRNQSRVEEQVPTRVVKQTYVREIGKIRRYIAATGEFSEWEDLPCQTYGDTEPRRWNELNIDESIEIPLRRGGRLRVFPNFVADERRTKVSNAMDKCTLYRQYFKHGDEMTSEARMQVLLSSKVNQVHNGSHKRGRPGYHYDGITMMAQPLSQVEQVEQLTRDLAELYRLPGKEWNIGTNLVGYRTGEDHMAWHSNCDQGEVLILCIVVESRNCTRPILIRPKNHISLQDGDEEIIVFVGQGDAYEMDGQMQLSYEHCMPKKEDDLNAKRTVVVFRHGRTASVTFDTGRPVFTAPNLPTAEIAKFGHPIREIVEAKEVFDRLMLVQSGAHRHDRKWANGTSAEGCESILVESQDPTLREDDGLCWLQVTCTRSDGGGALCQSYVKKNPVRVFRSSELGSRYAPAVYEDENGRVLYRYDGLYAVKAMWDTEGNETDLAPTGTSKHTFLLTRCPKRPVDGTFEAGMHYNRLSLQEVWNEVQKRRGVRKPRVFQVPQPFMDLHPIGHKSNLTRRRKDIIKLPSDDCFRKPRRKKSKSPSPVFGSLTNGLASDARNGNGQLILRSKEELGEEDVGNGNRPKRKAAADARSFLQEAMQNKFGIGEREQSFRKRRSAMRDDSAYAKRAKASSDDDDSSLSADSDIENVNSKPASSPILTAKKKKKEATSTSNIVDKKDTEKVDVGQQLLEPAESPPKESTKGVANERKDSSSKKVNRKKQVKASKTKEPIVESVSTTDETAEDSSHQPLDHSSIQVGYRVNVDYRDVLFKATIRRIRQKDGQNEYLIHYDGNKKSNVHWIQSSMIHSILSTTVKQEVTKPKGGRKVSKTSSESEEATQAQKANCSDSKQELLEGQKYPIGTEIFVEYRKVLYRAVIRNARLKKNGVCEYLVHYDGYKKNSDRWVKDSSLHDICDKTMEMFDDQRNESASDESPAVDVKIKKEETKHPSMVEIDPILLESLLPVRRTRGSMASQATDVFDKLPAITLDMGDNDPGVEFLPGSCVFVVRKDALYLAKMVKRRKRGKHMDYLVHFDGSTDNHDAWVPLSAIYEINPRTRRIFEQTADKREDMNDHDDEEDGDGEDEREESSPKKRVSPLKQTTSPVPSRRTKRQKKAPTRYQKDDDDQPSQKAKRGSGNKSGRKAKVDTIVGLDMGDIDSGVDFLPGSTIFVVWKKSLYLGKMLKKRGRGQDMEYYVHYDGFRKSFDSWVSISLIYEINPQTKRIFSKQRKG